MGSAHAPETGTKTPDINFSTPSNPRIAPAPARTAPKASPEIAVDAAPVRPSAKDADFFHAFRDVRFQLSGHLVELRLAILEREIFSSFDMLQRIIMSASMA
jgi:hypothetical protein